MRQHFGNIGFLPQVNTFEQQYVLWCFYRRVLQYLHPVVLFRFILFLNSREINNVFQFVPLRMQLRIGDGAIGIEVD